MVTMIVAGRLLLDVPYLSILFGVLYIVPAVYVYWFAARLWPVYLLRNIAILRGWDPVTHQTTRSAWGIVSRACAVLRLLLMLACAALTLNTIAGLCSGRVIGYFDASIVLSIPLEAYLGRYIVWGLLRLGPILWMLVQPSAVLETLVALETHDMLVRADYEDVLNRAARARGTLLERLPLSPLTLFSAFLVVTQMLFYAVAVVISEFAWFGDGSQFFTASVANPTPLGLMATSGAECLSLMLRLGEMLILAFAVFWKCFDFADEKEVCGCDDFVAVSWSRNIPLRCVICVRAAVEPCACLDRRQR